MADFIPSDNLNHIYNLEVDYDGDIFEMPRHNKDNNQCNLFARTLVDICCTHNIHILNGKLYDDKVGNVTCIANEGSSTVDYHIA